MNFVFNNIPRTNPIDYIIYRDNNTYLENRTLPYDYESYIDEDPLLLELLKKLSILLNPLCIHENYITNKIRVDFPNFIYETSCFKLLDSDNYDDIFFNISENYETDDYVFDLSENKDRIIYCATNGYVFLLKKLLYHLMTTSPSNYIDLDDAFLAAIKKNQFEIVKLLYQISPNLFNNINIKILEYITNIVLITNQSIFLENIQLFRFLVQKSSEIEQIIGHIITNHSLNYDEIINNLENVSINSSDIKDCPICYDTKSDLITECSHQYCSSCIKQWWEHTRDLIHKCPYCKFNIEPNNCKKIIS